MAAGFPKTQQSFTSRVPQRTGADASGVIAPGWLPRRSVWFVPVFAVVGLCPLLLALQLHFHTALGVFSAFDIANRHSHGTSIICLGDSLTQGVGASPGHDYPTLLSKTLGAEVINAGVDGDETEDALKRLDTDVLAKDPRLGIVELGANDFLDGRPLRQTFANLDEIVSRIEATGAMVALVGIAPGPMGDALQKDYDEIVRKRRIVFVPKVLEGILSDRRLKNSDGLHPNNQGYALIAERIHQEIEPLLISGRGSQR